MDASGKMGMARSYRSKRPLVGSSLLKPTYVAEALVSSARLFNSVLGNKHRYNFVVLTATRTPFGISFPNN